MARTNWSKRKLRAGEYEEKYDPGTVMANGRVVRTPKNSLAARAAAAEAEWLAERRAKAKAQRARRRKQKAPPTRAELTRLKLIRAQLGEIRDE